MATIYTKAIQEMYVAYFNRPADPAGLAYWEGVVAAANGSTVAVGAAFAASAEYKAEYEDLNVTGTLRQIYRNLFNDEADAPGLAYWANLVGTGAISIDKAVTAIAAGAQGVHATTFANKVAVSTAFTAALDTDAEKAGYNGELANTAAKEFLATITTDATATAALVPATLAASVASVIKAGVVFTVPSALAAFDAAVEAKADFLAAADGDDDEDTSLTEDDVADMVDAAQVDVGALVPTYAAAPTDGQKAAILADKIAANAKALSDANKVLATENADVAKVAGLSVAVAAYNAAVTAQAAAVKTAGQTESAMDGAEITYEGNNAPIVINANGTVTGVIELDGTTLVLASGVTEAKNPGVTNLLATIKADIAADKALTAANTKLTAATTTLNRTDVTLPAALTALEAVGAEMGMAAGSRPTAVQIEAELLARTAAEKAAQAAVDAAAVPTQAQIDAEAAAQTALDDLVDAIAAFDLADLNSNVVADAQIAAVADVKLKTETVEALDDAVAALAEAEAIEAQLASLNDAIDEAGAVFAENDFVAPVEVTSFVAGTVDADIFVAGSSSGTILNFGADDLLFIGTEYTLNTGKVATDGNNAVLEVFMAQSGLNTVITLETKTFGSNSADAEIVITLTGVNLADVSLANGIITI